MLDRILIELKKLFIMIALLNNFIPKLANPKNGHILRIDYQCSCKRLLDSSLGYGNCQKMVGGLPMCYVTQPSSCSDLVNSTTIPDEQWSTKACSTEGILLQI